jgi:hypothetical protein
MTKKIIDGPNLERFGSASGDHVRNRLLREWLGDDAHRQALYELINRQPGGAIEIPSRDSRQRECDTCGLETPRPPPEYGHTKVQLITNYTLINEILKNDQGEYSSRVYAELGGGNFMLALDPKAGANAAHAAQRDAHKDCFPHNTDLIVELAHLSCQAASIMSLRAPEFDLAVFAEQAALRFCQKLLGYALIDYRLLEAALRAGYRALVYQVLGRHFVTDPTVIPESRQLMGRLLARTSTLIDGYAAEDDDVLAGTTDRAVPNNFVPVMKRLGTLEGNLNGEQRAVIAVGAALGTMGNVQAATCIAVKAFFAEPALFEKAQSLARKESDGRQTRLLAQWQGLIEGPLRKNPPIPFLPRMKIDASGCAVQEVLLALGGATQSSCAAGGDSLIWGLPGKAPHWCAGQALAWPLVVEIVRHVMSLPGLAQRLDPQDASVIGLKKRWGFACESYPLLHQRERRVAQSTLNVAMRLKSPVKESADRVREVIRSGAPRIEEALRSARHVHFAWFELIEGDTVLVLHTVYDGPFWAYIQHFALKVGDLFDELFASIENPPPTPVDKFPNEFVAHIQRYDRAPAMGYFFSAYPRSEAAQIMRNEVARS